MISGSERSCCFKVLILSISGFSFASLGGGWYLFIANDIFDLINKKVSEDRKVFFIHGGVDAEDREQVREITEKEKDAIIVASYGTFSTGINIKNLHNVIFASPSKSRVRNLQSIGRVLRKGKDKVSAKLYDIADDLTIGSRKNYTLNHFIERVKIYVSEQFNYDIFTIDIKE